MNTILLLFVLALIKINDAYIITVDSHAEECFFDPAPAGSKLGNHFDNTDENFAKSRRKQPRNNI